MNMNQLHVFPAESLSTGELIVIVTLSIIVVAGLFYLGTKLGDYLFNKYFKDKTNKK